MNGSYLSRASRILGRLRPLDQRTSRLTLLWLMMLVVCIGMSVPEAHAHKPSDSYLHLSMEKTTFSGQWHIALRDLEYAVGLDADENGEITWGELRERRREVEAYALSRLEVRTDGTPFPLHATELLVDYHTDGAYAVLGLAGERSCEAQAVEVDYHAFFDLDPQHRGLLRLEHRGQVQTVLFNPDETSHRMELTRPDRLREFLAFVWHGLWHIWIGFDHILFLLALLLPAVLQRSKGRWEIVEQFTPAFLNVLKIVTAFTLAHSLTLSLATLGILKLNSRWVESVIAASVVLAALNNLRPFSKGKTWVIAFSFGLLHGFGFANVLADLGLSQGALLVSLVGFNLGVEIGQLAIVAIFLPLAFGLRRFWAYHWLTLRLGSAAIAMVATVWMVERMFEVSLLGF